MKAFKTESQHNRAGELQQISTRQLRLAMWPELCWSATEMGLRIIPGEKKIQKVLTNQAGDRSSNSGVTWELGISLMATTDPVRNFTLSKGKLDEDLSLQKFQI